VGLELGQGGQALVVAGVAGDPAGHPVAGRDRLAEAEAAQPAEQVAGVEGVAGADRVDRDHARVGRLLDQLRGAGADGAERPALDHHRRDAEAAQALDRRWQARRPGAGERLRLPHQQVGHEREDLLAVGDALGERAELAPQVGVEADRDAQLGAAPQDLVDGGARPFAEGEGDAGQVDAAGAGQ
jgi:hypothetical protein